MPASTRWAIDGKARKVLPLQHEDRTASFFRSTTTAAPAGLAPVIATSVVLLLVGMGPHRFSNGYV
jgi:hypothetical protein